ncbi:hypothetical protein QL285_063415 [Trifolium repens]|nr:hypothetical protein QL285_063415 [Trifolium repens]
MLDNAILSTPNVSASAENDISSSSQKTPATRRSAGKEKPTDNLNLDSQFSSTRSGKLFWRRRFDLSLPCLILYQNAFGLSI